MATALLIGKASEQDLIEILSSIGISDKVIKSRQGLAKQFSKLDLPNRRHEEWKWIDARVANISDLEFKPVSLVKKERPYKDNKYSAKVFVNQDYIELEVSPEYENAVTIEVNDPNIFLQNEANHHIHTDKLSAINDLFWTSGFVINILDEVVISKPIYIEESSDDTRVFKNEINIGRLSKVHLVHRICNSSVDFSNVAITAGDAATLDYYSIQNSSPGAVNIGTETVIVGKDATCRWFSLLSGSKLAKINQNCHLKSEGASCHLREAAILGNAEDLHVINNFIHEEKNTTCTIVSKAVATGKVNSSFRGRIMIDKIAQNSDAMLENRCLLLSEGASIHSIPILEILAKEVRCKHAASQGKIDPEQLFYMNSRGIDMQNAEKLIAEGFVAEVFKDIKNESILAMFNEVITSKAYEA